MSNTVHKRGIPGFPGLARAPEVFLCIPDTYVRVYRLDKFRESCLQPSCHSPSSPLGYERVDSLQG